MPDPNRAKDSNVSLSKLNAGVGRLLFPGEKLLIWKKSSWASISAFDFPVSNGETIPELEVYMGVGEYESTAFNLTNVRLKMTFAKKISLKILSHPIPCPTRECG